MSVLRRNSISYRWPTCYALVGCLLVSLVAWGQAPRQADRRNGRRIVESPQALAKQDQLIQRVLKPELLLRIDPTRSQLFQTKLPVSRIAITDPDVLEVTQYGPREFELIGQKSGETTLTLWFTDAAGAVSVLRYLVEVVPDRGPEDRAEQEFGNLQRRINELFPGSQIQLIPLINKLIVRGQARDAAEATQILAVIRGEVVNQAGDIQTAGYGGYGGSVTDGSVATLPGAEDLPATTVINLLQVPGAQQVMLKVRIAELTRTALRESGVDFTVTEGNFSLSSIFGGASNVSAILDSGDVELFIKAFSSNGHGKVLAEPTLVTLSGHTATFIAGGEFAVPTVVGVDGVSATSTTFRGFGTQLSFTPTVIDKDRIRLEVASSFSTIDTDTTVAGIPGLKTRAVTTTVDLREGQWLAIAGLIQDEQGGSRSRLPGLGDIPLIGAVFGSQKIRRDETELVILVSPELVHPMEGEQVPLILPGMQVTEPTGREFFLHQQIEGQPYCDHRSTVWPAYRHQLHHANRDAIRTARANAKARPAYQQNHEYYLNGPVGFSD